MGRVQAGIRPECEGENCIEGGGGGGILFLQFWSYCPAPGNVISFGVVSDSGQQAGWIGKSFRHGRLGGGNQKKRKFHFHF